MLVAPRNCRIAAPLPGADVTRGDPIEAASRIVLFGGGHSRRRRATAPVCRRGATRPPRGVDTRPLQNRAHRVGRLRPVADPVSRPIEIDIDRRRVGDGIVVADGFDEGPVTGRAAVGGDDAVAGPFLGAHPPQAKFDHAELLPLLTPITPQIAGNSSCGRVDDEASTSRDAGCDTTAGSSTHPSVLREREDAGL